MTDERTPIILIIISFSMVLLPIIIPIVKWFWLHPRVNAEKLKRRLAEANTLRERLAQADEFLLDLDLQSLKKHNIRVKGIRVIWSDNTNGRDKELNITTAGNDKTAEILKTLANEVRRDTTKKLLKICYKLPKRHGTAGDRVTAITIHGLNDPRIIEKSKIDIHDHRA